MSSTLIRIFEFFSQFFHPPPETKVKRPSPARDKSEKTPPETKVKRKALYHFREQITLLSTIPKVLLERTRNIYAIGELVESNRIVKSKMALSSLSPATQRCLGKSSVLLLVLIAVPLITSYWQIHQWLAAEKCVLYNNHTIMTICKARTHRPFVLNNTQLSKRPPDIASLISTITKASKDATLEGLDKSLRTLDIDQQQDVYDYSRESWMRLGILPTPNNDPMVEQSDTALGFRRNPNKQSMKHFNDSNKFPVATYFWLLLNVGLYGWYYSKRVDSSAVSINGQLLRNGGDFGRALSGNLAHFEILHLGVNGMSLLNLGQALERNNRLLGGTIGLLLWTGSFLVLTAYWVVILYIIDRNVGDRLWRRWSGTRAPSRFPSMVGFSGIIFAWSVTWALSLSKFQQTCPFPGLCFSTHNVGGFKFSWGPIVQLVLIQALLHKKVSFVGHLAGTIVGFLWHWGLLLPLEWSQPCILYPILWLVGKCIIYRWSSSFEALAGGSQEQEHSFGSASHLGGGQVLGSGGSRWTYESDQDESTASSSKTQLLYGVQKVLVVHAFLLLSVYGFGLLSPMVLSESLLLLIYVLFVRATVVGSPNDGVHPLRTLGIVGRA